MSIIFIGCNDHEVSLHIPRLDSGHIVVYLIIGSTMIGGWPSWVSPIRLSYNKIGPWLTCYIYLSYGYPIKL